LGRTSCFLKSNLAVLIGVQYDAPIGYPSITANYTKEWEKWWFNPEQVKLYQFMGKDNTYFHCVYFPSVQLADGRPWTMLHHISTTGEHLRHMIVAI
jgi:methionyl-tRNA synthetase